MPGRALGLPLRIRQARRGRRVLFRHGHTFQDARRRRGRQPRASGGHQRRARDGEFEQSTYTTLHVPFSLPCPGRSNQTIARSLPADNPPSQIFGKKDNHVPPAGRDLIRRALHDAGASFSFYEAAHAQHAFIRDELSKGRYDPAVSRVCFEMLLELFARALRADLGPRDGGGEGVEDVC